MAKVARVTLEGLTVLTQVCRVGDEIPFDELPTYLKRLVKAGQHPHLEYVDATVVEEVPGEDEGKQGHSAAAPVLGPSKVEKTVKSKAAPKGKLADEDKSAEGGSQEEPEAGKDEPDKAAKE
jgi:hypothetical protein